MRLDASAIASVWSRARAAYVARGSLAVVRAGLRFVASLPERMLDAVVIAGVGVRTVDSADRVIAGTTVKVRVRWRARPRTDDHRRRWLVRYRFLNGDGGVAAEGASQGTVLADCESRWRDLSAVVETPSVAGAHSLHIALVRRGFVFPARACRLLVLPRSADVSVARMAAVDVTMDLTSKCPLRCIQCRKTYTETPEVQHDMDFTLFMKIASEVFPHARTVMLSSAGEPLMSRHFIDAIDVATRYPMQEVSFASSGLHLDRRRAQKIIDRDVGRVEFSVDGATPAVYNGIRAGSDFDKVVANIRYLAACKRQRGTDRPLIRINVVLMRRNIDELAPLVDLAEHLGAEEVLCQHMIVFSDTVKGESLLLDKARSNRRITEAKERAASLGIRFYHPPLFNLQPGVTAAGTRAPSSATHGGDPNYSVAGERTFERVTHASGTVGPARCSDPWRKISFDWQGQVYPCCMWKDAPIGDMRTATFAEIWNSSGYRQLRETLLTGPLMKSCAECSAITGGDVNNDGSFVY